LHCRHEARVVARERRKRLMLRGSAVAVVIAIVGVAGILSAGALRSRGEKGAGPVVQVASSTRSTKADTQPAIAPVTQQGEVAHRTAATPTIAPIVPVGESSLGEGVAAVRADSVVLLTFDTPMSRTRIPEKFEHFVRTTLPRVYGPVADSALARVPAGSLARSQRELLYELPTRGMHIPLRDGRNIVLYPETRPGDDGPLVIRYRVSVTAQN
jgi:hypothetical protein